jgi:hypothetical protein
VNDQQHPDPGGEAMARAAQLAAMTLSVGEALVRLRAQRLHDRAADDQREAAAGRAAARAYAAESAVIYRQALRGDWIYTSPTEELLGAWRCAEPYRDTDPTAKIASDRVEDRLRQLHPEAMAVYDSADLQAWPAQHRMQQVIPYMRGPYGLDPVGTPTANHEQARAAADLGSPDDRGTPDLDERTASRATAAGHQGQAAAHESRPVDVVTQAFPVPIHDAMRTAPKAAAGAVKAITAGPIRKQLTATPHELHRRQPTGSPR